MHYIINPWILYLISLVGNIGVLSVIIILSGIGLEIIVSLGFCDDLIDGKTAIRYAKKIFIMMCIAGMFVVFLPSKKTMKEMLVASYITEENVSATKESAKELVDYIVEKIEEVKNEKK